MSLLTRAKKRVASLWLLLAEIPSGVRTIVGLCLLMRVMQMVVAEAPVRTVLLGEGSNYLLVPDVLTFLFAIHGIGLSLGFFWTPVTYMFLHGSTSHLVLNLIGLLTFGTAMEKDFGKRQMWIVFISSGIIGGIGWTLANGLDSSQPCIGASAGVLGLVGAFAALRPREQFDLFIPFPIVVSAWALAAIIFFLNAAELVLVESHVAYLAHLVGILSGIISGLILKWITSRGTEKLRE